MSAGSRVADGLRLARDVAGLALARRRPRPVASPLAFAALDMPTLLDPDGPPGWSTVAEQLASVGIVHQTEGMNPGDRRALAAMVAFARPRRVLEVGTHFGASTLTIAAVLRALGEGELITVDIVDVNAPDGPWARLGLPLSPGAAAEYLGVGDRVGFHTGGSLCFLSTTSRAFDLVLLDGDHRARPVYVELCAALARLAPGGWIVLHDYHDRLRRPASGHALIPGPYLAVRRLRREGAPLIPVPLRELPWPTGAAGGVTSLAVLASAP